MSNFVFFFLNFNKSSFLNPYIVYKVYIIYGIVYIESIVHKVLYIKKFKTEFRFLRKKG